MPEIWLLVAEHPNASKEVLTRLSYKNFLSIRMKIAQHKNTPRTLLKRLAWSRDHTLQNIAQHALKRLK